MSNDDKNAALALMPYKPKNSNQQEVNRIKRKDLSVIDLLRGDCYSLNIAGCQDQKELIHD